MKWKNEIWVPLHPLCQTKHRFYTIQWHQNNFESEGASWKVRGPAQKWGGQLKSERASSKVRGPAQKWEGQLKSERASSKVRGPAQSERASSKVRGPAQKWEGQLKGERASSKVRGPAQKWGANTLNCVENCISLKKFGTCLKWGA